MAFVTFSFITKVTVASKLDLFQNHLCQVAYGTDSMTLSRCVCLCFTSVWHLLEEIAATEQDTNAPLKVGVSQFQVVFTCCLYKNPKHHEFRNPQCILEKTHCTSMYCLMSNLALTFITSKPEVVSTSYTEQQHH